MKKLLLILSLITTAIAFSQDLPSEPANGYAFPIGSKFVIKLYPIDSLSFDYSIIAYEPYEEVIDTWENDSLFNEEGQEDTVEFYFCLATSGDNEEERQKNMKVVLLMKNRSKYHLSYKSEIQIEEEGEFEETSNIGSFPNVKGLEMWPYMIYQIGLYDFKVRK